MTARIRWLWRFIIVALGICCIAAGVYMFRNWIEMFTRMRGKEMALSPTSRSYEDWKVSPLPLYFDVYLFNWTNPEDFYVGSEKKPRFVELGPYRFREMPDKVDIEWHNVSVAFHKKSYFFFDAVGSNGTLDDVVTSVNIAAHGAAKFAQQQNFIKRISTNLLLKNLNEDVSKTRTAREWMFEGYQHALVSLGRKFSPESVPYDRVGFLYPRNGSAEYDGHFEMYTGVDDIRKMGQIRFYNGKNHTGAYAGTCGDVVGSMGEFFPPNLSTNDSVRMFLGNMCRSVRLDYEATVSVHGVAAYKFISTERTLDNGTLYEENKCFCTKDKCQPTGVFDLGPCQYNSSVYMSFPHFYLADPSYLEAVEGLRPVKEKHEFFMTLEPNAGVPLEVGGGFQSNYLMEPISGVKAFENIPRTYIPTMWCEQRVRVTPEIAADVALVPLIVLLGQIVTGILLALGLICVCWYPTRTVAHICHSDDPKTKAKALKPLTFGHANGTTSLLRQQHNHQLQQPATNDLIGMRLLDYRRNSGFESNDINVSVTERLIGDQKDAKNVIIR